jgi:hypothetical protein
MKKRTSAWVLLLVTAGVLLSHLSWEEKDNGHLLMVDGVALDVVGHARDRWTKVTRQCESVSRVGETHDRFSQSLAVIQAYSPPASASAQLRSLWSVGDWLLAEVEFNDLLPAVVLLRASQTTWHVQPDAVWSGHTLPWKAAPHIRQYLQQRGYPVPSALYDCFEPQSEAFR